MRTRNKRTRSFKLAVDTLHVVLEVIGALAVLRLLVVAGAAREVRCCGMIGSRQRAVTDTVSVNIFVASEPAEPIQIFFAQNLATGDRFLWIFERISHPVIHSEIEIGHHKDQSLEFFRKLERLNPHVEALVRRRWQQHDVLGIAMRKERGGENVALRSAGWQAGGWTNALDVPDYSG